MYTALTLEKQQLVNGPINVNSLVLSFGLSDFSY